MDRRHRQLEMRLSKLFDLDPSRARRLVDEVLDALDESVDEFIATRHIELQRLGWKNGRIYAQIREELGQLRFRAPELSERQIRRRIYG